jgi:hypothetical protein
MRLPCQCPTPALNIAYRDYPCREPADEYILYGCLNQHTFELALCNEHATKWLITQKKYKHTCHNCDRFIEEHFSIQITSLEFYDGS